MKRVLCLILVACVAACSGNDQSLGETRARPGPVVDPDPDPDPDPMPTVPPCEDASKHARTGSCEEPDMCSGSSLLTAPGFECHGGMICCDRSVSCPAPPAPCGSGDGGMNQGGAAGEPSAGAGGA